MHFGFTITTKRAQYAGKNAKLILSDGTELEGSGFGASATASGELVFNTGMIGYTEALTDPSYRGQLLTMTYPLVGNYGVPSRQQADEDGIPLHFESDRIQASGLVVHELSDVASHWNLSETLDEWMHSEGVPGISGIDTRSLTKRLREGGVSMAALAVSDGEIDGASVLDGLRAAQNYADGRFAEQASTPEARSFGKSGEKTVVVIDVGAKNAIMRCVRSLGYAVRQLPWNSTIEQIMSHKPAGVVISNGPGDPQACEPAIQAAKHLIKRDVPTLGICLGAQILGIAGGARTYKLKYGHRGQNKPCLNLEDNKVYVTSQNHGYCIDPDSLAESEFDMWFKNADDGTVEGIRHKSSKCVAVQFHPEASPGPYDCRFVFDRLHAMIEGGGIAKK